MTVCPCKDCADRKVGCHTACKRYDDWRLSLQANKGKNSFEAYDLLAKNKEKYKVRKIHRH